MNYPRLSATEAAQLIKDGQTLAFSGFTPAGTPKAISRSLAARAEREHAEGLPLSVGVITGASTGASLDGILARANAISFRTPYQSDKDLRKSINAGRTRFVDMHLSMLPQNVRYGFLGPIDWAIIEASDVTPSGEIVLTAAVGGAPTFCRMADKILIELNTRHPKFIRGLHDIYEPADPPHRREIPIYTVRDRIGSPTIKVDPSKIVGIVETDLEDEVLSFEDSTPATDRIGTNVAEFLAAELKLGRLPASFLPVQSGVGNTANAVLGAMGQHKDIPPFEMYTEVIQNSVIDLMRKERITFASGVSLTIPDDILQGIYDDYGFFGPRLVLRPQEISNHPEVVRRLGLITINTAIEIDIFGNVNSTHVMGRDMMNGIGGSGDFTRNGFLSIFTCPSAAKGGKISTIVPFVSHLDHNEHSVQAVVTEQGVADLRNKTPIERAHAIIENCAHPDFRDSLLGYLHQVKAGHIPLTLGSAFAMHEQFLHTGDMRGTRWPEPLETSLAG